ncbi:MFS transporter [Mesorhizobium sp. M2A.F.Ca.ET.037.01.1.1]|uniref:MFS transporter n=5 Tax=Mesorhizobium TaxID=68287 RepID=UPI000F750AD7|nr:MULTISPECIES: MFS transporter [unclassified Mesorhizobium]RVC67510.1 MFS transporter [Mesorhizobium sp. M00.F.Ca.ET.038.03.1.1]RVC69352.1 MFS transporter [Mesorhizobium sp. M2A.F.Ca.ET.046.02.1.1]AZO37324.1 MFS transporter [Mesorhizobium sp. M2A.F.Ca.ET.046.03.2.1]RUX13273.1 MFS transporter [Mesorhizobium sp. M2A.F.Ca.ET.037.01.1.1]RWA91001.1 MAG: MFS transporter [Mesorhizobium sp.]
MLPLIALFLAAFAFGTTEFVIAGVLPEVAQGLGVSVPTAGYLVSGYACGIAIGGPLLALMTSKVSRKTLLIGLTIAFTLGQVACALAPDFTSMLLLRIATAVAHGCYFGVAMVVAVSLVREDQRGRAVAVILSGLTVSNVIGVPAGTAIGSLWGWRATFWVMGVLGIIAIVAMLALLPRTAGAASRPAGLAREVRVLGRQQVWTSLILMLMLMIGQFAPFTYITPMLLEVTGLDESLIPWVLLLNGVGATIGVLVGGKLADWKLMPSLIVMLALQAVALGVIHLVSPYPVPMIVAIVIWGGLNFAIGAPIQTRILAWTADASNLASALIPSGFNVGIALAASLGAAMLNAGYGYRSLPLAGALAMLVAVVVAVGSLAWEWRSRATPPLPAAAE